jgi:MFS family permease
MTKEVDLKSYIIVTAAYWGFTLTDGALRMLVLLHFHDLGLSPVKLAFLFLLYEFCGVLTNLFGGWIGARYGLRITLFAGLSIQILALLLLSFTQPTWTIWASVIYVMFSQALSGIAKDLTKMSSKSAVKLIANTGGERKLLQYVSILTGSKNALKGVGFFVGGFLLQRVGFEAALWCMATGLVLVLVFCGFSLKTELGRSVEKVPLRSIFSKSREVNILSMARFFLFGARDIWFVVALPVFLSEALAWSFTGVSTFLAIWVIGYGIVQASVPAFIPKENDSTKCAQMVQKWGFILSLITASISFFIYNDIFATEVLLTGLALFGVLFAINSTLHSYLILSYSDHDKVALNVGFYYMSNAFGRLVGTLLSGATFVYIGLPGALLGSSLMIAAASGLAIQLSSSVKTPLRR